MNHVAQAKFYELANSALGHYDGLARKACHWSSDVPRAIKYYYCQLILDYMYAHWQEPWFPGLCEKDFEFLCTYGSEDQKGKFQLVYFTKYGKNYSPKS